MIDLTNIKALTWKEPYATLMLFGKIETRTWKTDYRGWVLICSGKAPYKSYQILNISGYKQLFRIYYETLKSWAITEQNKGKAIAIAKLIDCRPMTIDDEDKCFVEYHPGLYCHIYENVLPIKPIPWKGKQGWSKVPDEIIESIQLI